MIDLGINLFQEIAALGGGGGGYPITNSLRFNDNDSANLSRTPATAGNRKKWTWSGWVKRGNINSAYFIFTANIAAGDESFEFTPTNTLRLRDGNSATTLLETNALLADPSGWYHIVLVYDSANSTGAIYVNGIQQSLSTNNISLNRDSAINNNVLHRISGYVVISASYFDGYLAETHFIDGQALTADDFGRTVSGEWSPIEYEGTYGTNGFYLLFDGNSNDSSGNGNNWTENNLASTDYMIDTPSNSFSVWNPLDPNTTATLSEGNLSSSSGSNVISRGTISISSGKYYYEYIVSSSSTEFFIGVDSGNFPSGGSTGVRAYRSNGQYFDGLFWISYGATYANGDVIGVAFDADANTIQFFKNNVSQGVKTGLTASSYVPVIQTLGNSVANFGADSSFAGNKTRQGNTDANGKGDFYHTPPAGYLALCTENTGGDPIADIT